MLSHGMANRYFHEWIFLIWAGLFIIIQKRRIKKKKYEGKRWRPDKPPATGTAADFDKEKR
jgi:hypothetical protein